MHTKAATVMFGISTLLFYSCEKKKPDDYPIEPILYYQATTSKIINIGDSSAFVRFELKFTDGDGDIGTDEAQATNNIFLKDSRDTSEAPYTYTYPFPYIAPEMRPTSGGLEGGITLNLGSGYFLVKDSLNIALRSDTLQFHIFVVDDAGHVSNTITTDTIFINF